jgi:hypothetical protein
VNRAELVKRYTALAGPDRAEQMACLADDYAAHLIEEHARSVPWPWPPKRPSRNLGGTRAAS